MLRPIALALLLCVVCAAPVLGQVGHVPLPGAALDSLLQAADRAGRDAARVPRVGGYFLTSFIGGLPAGFLGSIGVMSSDPGPILLGSVGAALVIGSAAHGAKREFELPPELQERLKEQPPVYREAFRSAYGEQLSRRRVKASLWGGAVGAGIGIGAVVWLLYSIGS